MEAMVGLNERKETNIHTYTDCKKSKVCGLSYEQQLGSMKLSSFFGPE